MMLGAGARALLICGCFAMWCTPSPAADPAELLEHVRRTRLDPSGAVAVAGLEIDLGRAFLRIGRGVLVPATAAGGRTFEIVFLGEARFVMQPPDAIEAGQLERFTRQQSLDASVQSAVMVLANEQLVASLLDRPAAALDATRAAAAGALFEQWVDGPERRGFGADAALFKALLGDLAFGSYVALHCISEELGSFYYVVDPTEPEQITLGQFLPIELDDIERHQLDRYIRKQRRKGRFAQLQIEDLGDWHTWVSTRLRRSDGETYAGSTGVEPRHYDLDVSISPRDGRIEGSAALRLRIERPDRRVLGLQLHPDLEVSRVVDAAGRDLFFTQSGSDLLVVLAEPAASGDEPTLTFDYGGVLFDELEKGIYALRTTHEWYPRLGLVDRATYEARLSWPARLELLASGRVVEEGRDDGRRWERRILELPALAFSFEVGAFEIIRDRAGDVDLTVGFSKASGAADKGAKEQVIETLKAALPYFEQTFGEYPLDYLSVATVPRGFSQGLPGFITLSHYLISPPRSLSWLLGSRSYRRGQRAETVAHELSHQWWGNKVGWDGYRDQWLSEALADYSAVAYMAQVEERTSLYLASNARRWRNSLARTTKDGSSYESLGPVVMGTRLNEAYSAVAYEKGSVVFSMLARSFGREPFDAMLKALADAVDHRVIDTETFLRSLERMSGADLRTFADQFIYGTGIPEVYYRYTLAPAPDGGWVIEGDARQSATATFRYEVERPGEGRWKVSRRRVEDLDVSDYALVVPFQISLRAEPGDDGARTARGLGGSLLLEGRETRFSIPLQHEPWEFWLDQRGEVLARFYCESREPKRMLRYRAIEAAADESVVLLQRALDAPLLSETALDDAELSPKQLERSSRLEDARIHLALAQVHLDRNDDAAARRSLARIGETVGGLDEHRFRGTRTVLESWLDVQAGDYRAAYGRLSKFLRLSFARRETDTAADDRRRRKFADGRSWTGDAYALLAISAYETGHEPVARRALDEAERRGAKMDALRGLLPNS